MVLPFQKVSSNIETPHTAGHCPDKKSNLLWGNSTNHCAPYPRLYVQLLIVKAERPNQWANMLAAIWSPCYMPYKSQYWHRCKGVTVLYSKEFSLFWDKFVPEATHGVKFLSEVLVSQKALQWRQTERGVSLAVRSQNGSMTYCMFVCMWLCVCVCVCCYYGESLRWHKLHSSWTKQPLYYLCLHFCLVCSLPHLSVHFVTPQPPWFPSPITYV